MPQKDRGPGVSRAETGGAGAFARPDPQRAPEGQVVLEDCIVFHQGTVVVWGTV